MDPLKGIWQKVNNNKIHTDPDVKTNAHKHSHIKHNKNYMALFMKTELFIGDHI